MNGYDSSEDQGPVMWLRGYPLYAAHVIVLVFVVSLIVTALLAALKLGEILYWLEFDSTRVLRGEIWRVFTYGLVNRPQSLWFVVDMFMIVMFGRELEKTFGRRRFFIFYGCVYLLTPLLFAALGFWYPRVLAGQTGALALFLAFATLYPTMPVFFVVQAKWLALIIVGMYTLIHLASHNTVQLISLWATAGFAFAFVRYQQGLLRIPTPRPKLRVVPDPKPSRRPPPAPAAPNASMAEVDALLDKIAQHGIGSLTTAERAKLDAAQAALQKRKSGGRS
jgi:membrane associated rhomboid family serine protease